MIIIQSSDISRYCNNQSDKTLQQDDTQPQDNQNTAIHTLQINSTENSLVLEKTSVGKYRLVSFSREASAYLSLLRDDIDHNKKFTALLNRCIDGCSPLSFFVKLKRESKIYRVSLLPIVHTRCVKILLTAEPLSCDNNIAANNDSLKSYSCFIDDNQGSRAIREMSDEFSKFLTSHLLCCGDICALKPVSDSFERGLPSSTPLVLNSPEGKTEFFTVHTLPIYCEHPSLTVALSIIPVKMQLQADEEGRKKNITKREREIINLVSSGYTNKYIAHKLIISEGTVKKTLYNAYKKLGVSSRAELINIFHSIL